MGLLRMSDSWCEIDTPPAKKKKKQKKKCEHPGWKALTRDVKECTKCQYREWIHGYPGSSK